MDAAAHHLLRDTFWYEATTIASDVQHLIAEHEAMYAQFASENASFKDATAAGDMRRSNAHLRCMRRLVRRLGRVARLLRDLASPPQS